MTTQEEEYAQSAFSVMQMNEELDIEDDPFTAVKSVNSPLYHGRLIYKTGEQVDYYRLLNDDIFLCKVNKDKPNSSTVHILKGWDWRETVTDGHNVDRAVNGIIGLPDYLEEDLIIYESQNAREFTDTSPRKVQAHKNMSRETR